MKVGAERMAPEKLRFFTIAMCGQILGRLYCEDIVGAINLVKELLDVCLQAAADRSQSAASLSCSLIDDLKDGV